MSAHDQLFGSHIPGDSVMHRAPVGAKYALVLLGTVPTLLARQWEVSLVALAVSVVLICLTRLPVRRTLGFGRGLAVLMAVILGYHALTGHPQLGVMTMANLLACLYLSRILTLTTPAPVLVDAIVGAVRPLERFGFPAERFGLAVALMLRSIPYLVGLFDDVRTAARARGLERNWFALVTPAVIGSVAYAQRTGDALAARGLGDD